MAAESESSLYVAPDARPVEPVVKSSGKASAYESPHTESAAADEALEYRALSSSAVLSVLFGLVSSMSIFAALTSVDAWLMLAPLPIAGLILGAYSWRKIRREPDQYTGQRLAAGGTLLSIGVFFAGLLLAGYVYATEVPHGYQRISFLEMKPDDIAAARHVVVPPEIMALDGKEVFIKGYIRPGDQSFGLAQFLLVRDNNECCFGDLSKVKYYDQVFVRLEGDRRTNYSKKIFRVGGKLKVNPSAARPGSTMPVFTLSATYVK